MDPRSRSFGRFDVVARLKRYSLAWPDKKRRLRWRSRFILGAILFVFIGMILIGHMDDSYLQAFYVMLSSVCITLLLVMKRLIVDTKPFSSNSIPENFNDNHSWIHTQDEDHFMILPPRSVPAEKPDISSQSLYETCPVHASWLPDSLEEQYYSLRRSSLVEYGSTTPLSRIQSDMSISSNTFSESYYQASNVGQEDWPFNPNDTYSYKDYKQYELVITVVQARNLKAKSFNSSNPFCVLKINNQEERTMTVRNTTEPVWTEPIRFCVETEYPVLHVSVEHEDFYCRADRELGSVRIPLGFLKEDTTQEGWFPLGSGCGQINLTFKYVQMRQEKVTKDSFTLRKVLGKGQCGKVLLVTRNDDLQNYAMKVFRKDLVLSKDKVKGLMLEKDVLRELKSPFLVELKYSFQTDFKLYFVMEYMAGGELFYYLNIKQRFNEEQSRFYLAEIILGLQALHEYGFVYRDLKPEHILLDEDGHIKLTDFSIGKKLAKGERTRTFCGTPEYFAPEVIQGYPYDFCIDFWSLGILAFEFMTGKVPFYHQNNYIMYQAILQNDPEVPSHLSHEAESLIIQLLEKDPRSRLGCGKLGFYEVKSHPFFKSIDWALASDRLLDPPFVPSQIYNGQEFSDDYPSTGKPTFFSRSAPEMPQTDIFSTDLFRNGSFKRENYISAVGEFEMIGPTADFGGLEFY